MKCPEGLTSSNKTICQVEGEKREVGRVFGQLDMYKQVNQGRQQKNPTMVPKFRSKKKEEENLNLKTERKNNLKTHTIIQYTQSQIFGRRPRESVWRRARKWW